jgi:hypothetical protein
MVVSDDTVLTGTLVFKPNIVLKGFREELEEWYAANPPTEPLVYQYFRERATVCMPIMDLKIFQTIVENVTKGTDKAALLKMPIGETICRSNEQFEKKLGRMQSYRNVKDVTLLVVNVMYDLPTGKVSMWGKTTDPNDDLEIEFSTYIKDPTAVRSKVAVQSRRVRAVINRSNGTW